MTHNDLSEQSKDLLFELNRSSLGDAVISCLQAILPEDSETSPETIIGYLRSESEELPSPYYLKESLSGAIYEPEALLKHHLAEGWPASTGFRIPITVIPDWSKYQSKSRSVRYKIHAWDMLDLLLRVDSMDPKIETLKLAIDIADDWIVKHIISTQQDDFAWYDMGVGQRATKLSYMIRRLIQINADSDLILRFILAAQIHFSELMDIERIATHSNHGLFQIAGLISLSKNLPWMLKSEPATKFAENVLKQMLSEHFSEDGLHLEHSPEYHLFMAIHLSFLNDSGWLSNEFDSLSDFIMNVANAANWMATPEMKVIPLGDTANNARMSKLWSRVNSNLTLGMKLFEKGGLLINNSISRHGLNSQLVFSAQFHSRQHKQADNLNVLYHLNGRPLLVDPGTFTYQYDTEERMYCESTRAHNTIEIDNLNHSRYRHDSYGSGIKFFATAGDILISEGLVNHKRLISSKIPNNQVKGTDSVRVKVQQRRIVIERPDYFLAVIDQLNSTEDHDYTAWYHLHPDLVLGKSTQTRLMVSNNEGAVLCQIQSYDSDSNSLDCEEIRGETVPELQGWFSENGKELIPNSAIGFRFQTASTIVTVFDFHMKKTGKPYLRVGTGGKYIRFALTQAEKKFDVRLKIGEKNIDTIEVELDGQETETTIKFKGD
jgi:hypothetical protein